MEESFGLSLLVVYLQAESAEIQVAGREKACS
jgi:hypothetical protein